MEEEERLLYGKHETASTRRITTPRHLLERRGFTSYLIAIHVFLVFSLFANIYLGSQIRAPPPRLTVFPDLRRLQTVIQAERPIEGIRNSAFDGPPGDTSSGTWDSLLQNFYIRASTSEVLEAGFDPSVPVRLKDGDYLTSLGVYQELHCLNQLRSLLYNQTPIHESSHQPISGKEFDSYHDHLDWCIEVLRISVTCDPDLSLYTYTWPKEKGFEALNAHAQGEGRCVDWNQIEEWATRQSVGLTPEVVVPEKVETGHM
jgi:hypothetical protein